MDNTGKFHQLMVVLGHLGVDESLKRLEGMQGPEQGLVGESPSDEPTRPCGGLPGERGVGEIGGAGDLRKYIDTRLIKARQHEAETRDLKLKSQSDFWRGVIFALGGLQARIDEANSERSDLSNDLALASADK